MSERIVIEYSTFGPGNTYQYTVAATVSSSEAFLEALGAAAQESYDQGHTRHPVDLDVDGILLQSFPVKEYLEDKYACEVLSIDEWFEQKEMENSSQERLDRLAGVVGTSPL